MTAVAIHEAGHAAAYLHYSIPFRAVEISGDVGAVEVTGLCRDPQIYAVIALCGPSAEARYTGATLDTVLASGGRFDRQNAQRALAHLGDDALSFEQALAWAVAIVASQWPLIERIACELLRCGRLDYAAVRRLDDHTPLEG